MWRRPAIHISKFDRHKGSGYAEIYCIRNAASLLRGNSMVTFREAEIGDAESLALLHANSWRQTYRGMMRDEFLDGDVVSNWLEVWRDRLSSERDDQCVLLAANGTQLVGFVCAFGNEDSKWGSYIDNLHVSHEHKRTGIGTLLM